MGKQLVANRLLCDDGTVLQSFNRHDYKYYTDDNGKSYMNDGGLDYMRRSFTGKDISVYTDDRHEKIRLAFHWGSRGKDNKQDLHYLPLYSMSMDHIKAILETQNHIPDWVRKIFQDEITFRK